MKVLSRTILVLVLAFSQVALGEIITGSQLKGWIDIDSSGSESQHEWQARFRLLGFIEGVSGTLWVRSQTCHLPAPEQIIQASKNYLERHPEVWDEPAVLLVSTAMARTFPCYAKN